MCTDRCVIEFKHTEKVSFLNISVVKLENQTLNNDIVRGRLSWGHKSLCDGKPYSF